MTLYSSVTTYYLTLERGGNKVGETDYLHYENYRLHTKNCSQRLEKQQVQALAALGRGPRVQFPSFAWQLTLSDTLFWLLWASGTHTVHIYVAKHSSAKHNF